MNVFPRHLHHITFPVSDLNRSLRFYREMLGAELVVRREVKGGYLGRAMGVEDLHVELAVLRLAGAKIELMRYRFPPTPPAAPPANRPGGPHLNVLVENMENTWKEFRLAGVHFVGDPVEIEEGPNRGGRIAFIYDPDGYRIELMELTPRRLHELHLSVPIA